MADLTVTVKEEILLPNNNFQSTNNITVIKDVNQIVRRIDTIATTFSGSGIEILKFVDSEPQQVAGSFVKKDTKSEALLKGGFVNQGKGTVWGDGKDKAMRRAAQGFIGEITNPNVITKSLRNVRPTSSTLTSSLISSLVILRDL